MGAVDGVAPSLEAAKAVPLLPTIAVLPAAAAAPPPPPPPAVSQKSDWMRQGLGETVGKGHHHKLFVTNTQAAMASPALVNARDTGRGTLPRSTLCRRSGCRRSGPKVSVSMKDFKAAGLFQGRSTRTMMTTSRRPRSPRRVYHPKVAAKNLKAPP